MGSSSAACCCRLAACCCCISCRFGPWCSVSFGTSVELNSLPSQATAAASLVLSISSAGAGDASTARLTPLKTLWLFSPPFSCIIPSAVPPALVVSSPEEFPGCPLQSPPSPLFSFFSRDISDAALSLAASAKAMTSASKSSAITAPGGGERFSPGPTPATAAEDNEPPPLPPPRIAARSISSTALLGEEDDG